MITPRTDHDAALAAAERDAVVVWRGERIPFGDLRRRIAETDSRSEREGLYASWIEALEAMHPLHRARHEARPAGAPPVLDAGELERFTLASETEYHAALRRYLAQLGIEQGDATLADAWHIERGSAWSSWFGPREIERALTATGRRAEDLPADGGWRAARWVMAGTPGTSSGRSAVGELFGWLVGDPTWLADALRMAPDDIPAFADFAAFVRLWEVRRSIGIAQYHDRLRATEDEALQRAYFSGVVGHVTGLVMPEAAYLWILDAVDAPVPHLERSMLAGAMAEQLESRFGPAWWSVDEARGVVDRLAETSEVRDVLAQLGYHAMDWRPLLRQIRTRLIGEMSGYGGPNITTRAGTRKV
ncbi:MAG: hypothetical protein ABIW50_05505 [Candidatus Limnocylindria bacterium]